MGGTRERERQRERERARERERERASERERERETDRVRELLVEAVDGEHFLLRGGDTFPPGGGNDPDSRKKKPDSEKNEKRPGFNGGLTASESSWSRPSTENTFTSGEDTHPKESAKWNRASPCKNHPNVTKFRHLDYRFSILP